MRRPGEDYSDVILRLAQLELADEPIVRSTFTPSPIRSPSLSSTTSPRWMPTRNLNAAFGRHASVSLDQASLHFDRAADRSTTLRNSMIEPSPVRLTMWP